MGQIIALPERTAVAVPVNHGEECHVMIFPGVRIERHEDPSVVENIHHHDTPPRTGT